MKNSGAFIKVSLLKAVIYIYERLYEGTVEIRINTKKSLEQNASEYFEKAKKARKKIEGVKEALKRFEQQKEKLLAKQESALKKAEKIEKPKRKKEWYEKFHWFISSEGFLCIGGRDATTNEIVIKKHTDASDTVFHTEAPGSPFFVVKKTPVAGWEQLSDKPGYVSFEEAAIATAVYSKAWKMGITTTEVFSVAPEQVTKEAKAGEFVPKGAFMIYGKRTQYRVNVVMSVGITKDGVVMGGPERPVKLHCEKAVNIIQGAEKTSDIAKKIKKILGSGELDDIIAVLPAGGCEITS